MLADTDIYTLAGINIRSNFPGGSMVKNLPANAGDAGDMGLIPGSGRSLERDTTTHSSTWEAGYISWGHNS